MQYAGSDTLLLEDQNLTALKPGALALLRLYRWPLLALLIAVPVTLYAVVTSLDWFQRPFPGFLMMENAVVPTVSGYEWPPDKAALFHHQVIAVDGVGVHSSADVYAAVARKPPGTPITYTLRLDGKESQVTVASMPFSVSDYMQTYGILLVFACANLTIGLVVGFLQPRTRQARIFLLHTFFAGIYPATGIFLHHPAFHWLNWMCLTAECLTPATFIHLALVFPVERHFTGLARLCLLVPYVLSVVLFVTVRAGFYHQPPALGGLHVTYLYFAAALLFFTGTMGFAYWENADTVVRSRITAVLPGAVLAAGVQFFIFTNNALTGRNIPMQFGLVTPIPYYLTVAYAIAKHDLFDIDRVVRQSFVYGLLTLLVFSIYAVALEVPGRLIPGFTGQGLSLVGGTLIVILAFALDPLRRLVQSVVDRAFYRTRLDYRATIRELSEVMTTLLRRDDIVAQVTRVLTDAMQLESTALCVMPGAHDERSALWVRRTEGSNNQQACNPVAQILATVCAGAPHGVLADSLVAEMSDPAIRAQARDFLAAIAAQLVLPLVFRGQVLGLLMLGPKRSGRPFSSDDVDLLRTLANQTAIAVENARSYQALEELNRDLDAKVREQTAQLRASRDELGLAYDELKSAQTQLVQSEKMASLGQLVAGVAHELNNPASFVHGGLANLEEYLRRLVDVLHVYERLPIADPDTARAVDAARSTARLDYVLRETPELLRICAEGSERIKKIVDDLRVFVRADQGQRMRTDIAVGVDSTVRLLADRLQRGGIVVRTEYAPVPPIDAHAGPLNQVWMNLLSNAIDAVHGRPNGAILVTMRLSENSAGGAETSAEHPATHADECVEVSISDNGAGIAPEHLKRIFEPFFTTKPIGQGTGLGLSIAYGAVKSHGGTIDVDSTPGCGTTVTVRLPLTRVSH